MPVLGWFCQMLPINHKPNETRPAFKEKEKLLSPQFQKSEFFPQYSGIMTGGKQKQNPPPERKKQHKALPWQSRQFYMCKNLASKPNSWSMTATMNLPAFYPIKNKPTPLNVTTSPVWAFGRPFWQASVVKANVTPQLPKRNPICWLPASCRDTK